MSQSVGSCTVENNQLSHEDRPCSAWSDGRDEEEQATTPIHGMQPPGDSASVQYATRYMFFMRSHVPVKNHRSCQSEVYPKNRSSMRLLRIRDRHLRKKTKLRGVIYPKKSIMNIHIIPRILT